MITNELLALVGVNTVILIGAFYFISSSSKKAQIEAMEKYHSANNEIADKNVLAVKKMLENLYKGLADVQKNLSDESNTKLLLIQEHMVEIGGQIEKSKSELAIMLKENNNQAEIIIKNLNTLNEKISELKSYNSESFNMISHDITSLKREIEDKLNVQTDFLKELTSDFRDF